MTEKTGLELAREREEKLANNASKFLLDAANIGIEEITIPPGIAIGIINTASSIVNGPEIPNPMMINNFIKDLTKQEYEAGPAGEWGWWGASGATGLVGGGVAYDVALNKIQKAYPKLYANLTKAFPYSVGQIHGATLEALSNSKAAVVATAAGKSPLQKIGKVGKDLIKRMVPSGKTLVNVSTNAGRLTGLGFGLGVISDVLMASPTGGSGLVSDTPEARQKFVAANALGIDPENLGFEDYSGTELAGLLDPYYFNQETGAGTGMPIMLSDIDEAIAGYDEQQGLLREQEMKEAEEERKVKEKLSGSFLDRRNFGRGLQSYFPNLGNFFYEGAKEKIIDPVVDFVSTPMTKSIVSAFVDAKTEEEPYDAITMTPEYIAEDAKDKAMNEQYMADKGYGLINQAPFVDSLAMGGEPGLATNIFEESDVVTDGPEQIQMASLVGKAPIWAVGNVPKPKIGTQDLTKAEKTLLDNLSNKILDDADESIIDSPEPKESAFYSGLEARLMDPNTPKTFNSVEDFYKFLQSKQISKKEIEDNILDNYLAIATKNKTPLVKEDMLKIVRQAPMRKVDSIVYGNANYGGEKNAIYTSYKEGGEIPGSYRESVLYLDPKYIPQDPDSLPRSSHDFNERYVIGWSRKTDRNATLPVEKTAQGIAEQVDPAMIRTLKRNSTKLKNQLKGLEASAYEKIRRALDGDLTPTDEMNARMIRETIDSRMTFLEEIDMPLANQIRQFRSKIQDDSVRLGEMEAATQGKKVVVTFADEIQSDILQQAKELENELRQQLGSILDLPVERRAGALAQERTRYSGSARNVEPEVLDFYTKNETIFRPMFNTAEEMQSFVDEFQKNKVAIDVVAKGGPAPSDEAIKAMNIAIKKEQKMLEELNIGLSEGAMKQLFPNVPFKNREEWGDILVKRDLTEAAQRLFMDKVDGAAEWYAISPADLIKKRYAGQGLNKGGTDTPLAERTAAKERGEKLKGIGVEEFYGGPDSVDTKGKHYTSSLEKSLKRAAKENNSEFKIIEVDGVGKVFAIKLTPEMLLPHKTHRKDGGMVYTPEIIDIFEAA